MRNKQGCAMIIGHSSLSGFALREVRAMKVASDAPNCLGSRVGAYVVGAFAPLAKQRVNAHLLVIKKCLEFETIRYNMLIAECCYRLLSRAWM